MRSQSDRLLFATLKKQVATSQNQVAAKGPKQYGPELQDESFPFITDGQKTCFARKTSVNDRSRATSDGRAVGTRPNVEHANFVNAVRGAMPKEELTACISNAADALGRLLHLTGLAPNEFPTNPWQMLLKVVNTLLTRAGHGSVHMRSTFANEFFKVLQL